MEPFNTMDEETAALIIQLQIEDSQELAAISEGKGKGREGHLTDTQFALELYKEELQRNACIFNDRKMTKSIAQACKADGRIVTLARSEEQVAASDRDIVFRLAGRTANTASPAGSSTPEHMDDELLAKLSALYVSDPLHDSDHPIEVGKHLFYRSQSLQGNTFSFPQENTATYRCYIARG